MKNVVRPLDKKSLVYREPEQTETASGLLLPSTKICKARRCRILSVGKNADPELKPGMRCMIYAYDSNQDFLAPWDLEFPTEEEVTHSAAKFPEGITYEDGKIKVRKGTKIEIMSHDMIQFLIDEEFMLSDQKELG